ncbi:MAG TPA: lysophospholipid acyltransferase family protein [Cyclobacteriaceae bacterium]|nr:lysophospholipid acyltransferase family protein [Cyclobacteriaceae bacterium]
MRLFLRVIVGVRFSKSDFLASEKQFIIVANHNSHLDTMTLLASLPGKILHKVKPVAAADHFGKTKLKTALSNYFVNTLLIQRKRDKENPENDPINKMIKALDAGYSLILFPEGTRGTPEVQQPLKPGVAFVLLERPDVKYVPAYMKGMGKAMPKDDNLIVPHSSSLVYGRPTLINSGDVAEIMEQIEQDLNVLKES